MIFEYSNTLKVIRYWWWISLKYRKTTFYVNSCIYVYIK